MTTSWMPFIIIGVLSFIIFSPLVFGITNAILGGLGLSTTSYAGAPTWLGVALHAVIFTVILKLLLGQSV